jgi:glycosyltransferase involved in cell wall biosynthesis
MLTNACWRRSVVDIDDLPSSMERTLWRSGTDARARMKAWLRMLELRVHESRLKRRFDVFAVCSEADRRMLDKRSNVRVIPNGFAPSAAAPMRNISKPPRIGFMGLYSYLPNLEGIRWFMKNCWPQIKRAIPDVRLRLVGKDSDGPLKPDDSQVDGLGWVEDPAAEIATWSLMIVPIRIGGGTRVKIPDAFSRKCPVVATRFGALGYKVENDKELVLADRPADFAEGCVSLIQDPERARGMGETAYSAFLEKWTWDASAPHVWAAVEDCMRMNWVG